MRRLLRAIAAGALALSGVALIVASGGTPGGAATWSKSFGGEFSDLIASAIPTADGGYLFVGNRDYAGGVDFGLSNADAGKIWVVKLDSTGDISWEKGLGEAALTAETSALKRFYSQVIAAADGGAWLVGIEVLRPDIEHHIAGTRDLVVARLDNVGQVAWTRVYDSDAALPVPHSYPDGTTTEAAPVAAETPEGALWIAARADAFVRDTTGGGADPDQGVAMSFTYLLKLAPDGAVLASRHADMVTDNIALTPRSMRVLEDGGVALTASSSLNDCLLVADAAGALRSKTRINGRAVLGAGAGNNAVIADFVPMRRNAVSGVAGDDGYVLVGDRAGVSFVARYLASPRDADDPTEGEGDGEIRPLENAWRLEVPEFRKVWVTAPRCGAAPLLNRRCSVILAGESREVAGEMVLAAIDPDANVSGNVVTVPGIAQACAMQREPALTDDGREAFRIIVRAVDGSSGTVVIDDQRFVRQPYVSSANVNCAAANASAFASSGEWVFLSSSAHPDSDITQDTLVARLGTDGLPRWSASFPGEARSWSRALALRQTDDGFIVAGESGTISLTRARDSLLFKLDREGALLWQHRLPGLVISHRGDDLSTNALAVRNDDYLLAARDSDGVARALKFDRAGTLVWQKPLWRIPWGSNAAVAPLRDGGWILAADPLEDSRLPLLRLNASGDVSWIRGMTGIETVDSIVESAQGELVLAGRDPSGNVVAKLDSAGAARWSREFGSWTEDNAPVRVAVLADGGILVASTNFGARLGASSAEPDPDDEDVSGDVLLIRFDADGARQWERRYGGLYADVLGSLAATDDGGAILGAVSTSLGERNDRSEGWLLRVARDGGISAGCAAEQVPSEFAAVTYGDGALVSRPLDPAWLGIVAGAVPASLVTGTLTTSPLGPASTVARQCSGSVGRPRDTHAPVAHLRVIQGGTITGVVSSVPAGILCGVSGGGSCEADFDENLLVTLNIDGGSRATFESWTGCDSIVDGQCRVRMSADRTVTATFATTPRPPTVSLILNNLAGRGTVTGTGGINCRATNAGVCTISLQRGSTAQLTATPDASRSFLGWEGTCAAFGNTRSIMLVMNEGATCAARFSGPPPGAPELTVELRGGAGNVTSDPAGIDCGANNALCTEGFSSGSTVTLTAAATQPGWEFDHFLCQGYPQTNERTIALADFTTSTSCLAEFSQAIERLYVRIVRDAAGALANGRVYVEGGGLDCRRDCDRPFTRDQVLILRAEPYPDYTLSGWSGCEAIYPDNTHPGAPTYCRVRMDQRRNVVAFFSRLAPGPDGLRSLIVNFANGSAPGLVTSNTGAIDCTPTDGICVGAYPIATDVRLDVVPAAGGTIASNVGCDTFTPAIGTTPAQCRVTMVNDRAVTFGFSRPNNPPVAAFSFEPANPLAGQPVTFDASSSSDDSGIAGYAWSFFDNGEVDATASVTTLTYATPGTYPVKLTVTDASGLTDDEVRNIVVAPATAAAPVITQQPQNVTVDIGAIASFSVVATGVAPLSYRWQRGGVDIPGGVSANYTTPAVTSADDGAVFRVIVTNGVGSTTSATAVLTVGRGWRVVGGTIASPAFRPSLALDAADTRYVSYAAPRGSVHGLFVKQSSGTGWSLLGGGAVDPLSDESAQENMLVIGADGLPIVSWIEATRVRVARWTGTQWNFIGNDISVDTTDTALLSNMQTARDGANLVVAWTEIVGFPIPERRIAVKRYDAAAGTWSGGYVPDVTDAIYIRMALDAAGLPTIAYVPQSLSGVTGAIRVVRQSATGWAPFGGDVGPVPTANSSGLAANYGFDIRFDATNVPVVFGSVDGLNLFAYRNPAGAWQPLTGTDGVFVSLDPVTESTAIMAFTRSGPGIAVAYTRSQRQSNGGVRFLTEFLHFDGTAWFPIGEPLSFLNYSISPQLDSTGNPIFAAEYRPPGGFYEVVVQQFIP